MTGVARRILLVLQAPPFSDTSFEPVLRIARRTDARVEGVFVEDSRLLDIAAHPSARFIHAFSRETTSMDEHVVRRAIRVSSVRTRQQFVARITASAIPWSFSSRQCADLSEAFSEATAGDLVIVPLLDNGSNIDQVAQLTRTVTKRAAVSLLVLNERGTPTESILVLFDGDLDDLDAALELADNFDCRATIVAVADNEATCEKLTQQARTHLGRQHRAAGVAAQVFHDATDLDKAIRAAAPATLVVDRNGRAAQTLDLAALLATSHISLYLRN